jgi:hypothetical protein
MRDCEYRIMKLYLEFDRVFRKKRESVRGRERKWKKHINSEEVCEQKTKNVDCDLNLERDRHKLKKIVI